jgi:hypothetical protein
MQFGRAEGVDYAGFLLLLRHGADGRRPPLFDATAAATIAAVALGDTRIDLTWSAAAWLLLLALGPQVIGWLLITVSLPRLPTATTSLLLMIQPVGSLLLAAVIFSERPNSLQLVGVGIVLVAVLFATRWQSGPSSSSRRPFDERPPGHPRRAGRIPRPRLDASVGSHAEDGPSSRWTNESAALTASSTGPTDPLSRNKGTRNGRGISGELRR